jgi:uncharacterized membrane protein
MKLKVTDVLSLVAIVAIPALAAALYSGLPDPLPVHWDAHGVANGYAAKSVGVVLLGALPLGVFLLMKALPSLSPRGFRLDTFQSVVDILTATLTIGTAGLGAAALLAASGRNVPIPTVAVLVIGAILVVTGNYLGKTRKNFFIGVRTPWTLASDEVWARTHRLAGWLFVVAGLATLALAWDTVNAPRVLVGLVLVAALVPVVYSFWLYRKLDAGGERPE